MKTFCTLLIKMIFNFKTIKSKFAEHRFKFKKHDGLINLLNLNNKNPRLDKINPSFKT